MTETQLWATSQVAEYLHATDKVIIWPEDTIDSIADFLDSAPAAANKRNYFAVDVSISPSELSGFESMPKKQSCTCSPYFGCSEYASDCPVHTYGGH